MSVDKDTKQAEQKPDMLGEFTLSKPIKAYGEDISVLKLRRIIGKDLTQLGNPVIFTPHTEPPRIDFDFDKLVAMIARLAAVPSASLEEADPQDLIELGWTLVPFLIPVRRKSSSNGASI
jgi:hypothetical protein